MKRKLDVVEAREIMNLKEEDINMQLLRDYFAVKKSQDAPRFSASDTFRLPSNKLYNRTDIETTVGRYLINMYLIPDKYLAKKGYQNITYTAGDISSMEKELAVMFLNDELNAEEYSEFLDRGEWITLGTSYFMVPTMNYDMNVPIPEVIKRRDELFEEYAEEIAKGDSNASAKIESELLTLSKELIKEKGNEGFDFFESGEFNFANNYKKTSIMSGAVENPYTKKLDILKSNYIDGISKEDFPYLANITVIGGYSRGVETQKAGYETKKINNAMQVVMLDEEGTNCGTQNTLRINLPDAMKAMFLYRNIVIGNEILMLTDKNIDRYVGKDIYLRSPMYCTGDKICHTCSGDLFHKLGMKNAGLLNSTMSGSLMNLSMKKFHDTTIKFDKIEIEKYIQKK